MITEARHPTRERILDAAVELFGRQGYAGTSVGEIERRPASAPRSGALYKHFPSKRALLLETVRRRGRAVGEITQAVDAEMVGDVRAELHLLGRMAMHEIAQRPARAADRDEEGDNFPELREEFYARIVSSGHGQAVEWLRLVARARRRARSPAGPRGDRGDAARARSSATASSRRSSAARPLDVDEERFLAVWQHSAESPARSPRTHPRPGGPDVTHGDHITRNRGAIRFLLFALGIPQALIGLMALLAPRTFYDDFPAGTDGWVHVLGPFDEHLVTDVGALFVALGVLLSLAAINLRRSRGRRRHGRLADLQRLPTSSGTCSTSSPTAPPTRSRTRFTLGWTVLGGVLILCLARRPGRGAASRSAARRRRRAHRGRLRQPRRAARPASAIAYSKRSLGAVTEPARVFAHHPCSAAATARSRSRPSAPTACRRS